MDLTCASSWSPDTDSSSASSNTLATTRLPSRPLAMLTRTEIEQASSQARGKRPVITVQNAPFLELLRRCHDGHYATITYLFKCLHGPGTQSQSNCRRRECVCLEYRIQRADQFLQIITVGKDRVMRGSSQGSTDIRWTKIFSSKTMCDLLEGLGSKDVCGWRSTWNSEDGVYHPIERLIETDKLLQQLETLKVRNPKWPRHRIPIFTSPKPTSMLLLLSAEELRARWNRRITEQRELPWGRSPRLKSTAPSPLVPVETRLRNNRTFENRVYDYVINLDPMSQHPSFNMYYNHFEHPGESAKRFLRSNHLLMTDLEKALAAITEERPLRMTHSGKGKLNKSKIFLLPLVLKHMYWCEAYRREREEEYLHGTHSIHKNHDGDNSAAIKAGMRNWKALVWAWEHQYDAPTPGATIQLGMQISAMSSDDVSTDDVAS